MHTKRFIAMYKQFLMLSLVVVVLCSQLVGQKLQVEKLLPHVCSGIYYNNEWLLFNKQHNNQCGSRCMKIFPLRKWTVSIPISLNDWHTTSSFSFSPKSMVMSAICYSSNNLKFKDSNDNILITLRLHRERFSQQTNVSTSKRKVSMKCWISWDSKWTESLSQRRLCTYSWLNTVPHSLEL